MYDGFSDSGILLNRFIGTKKPVRGICVIKPPEGKNPFHKEKLLINRKIGGGNQGTVYLAISEKSTDKFAIKVPKISEDFEENQANLRSMVLEYETINKLISSNPNLANHIILPKYNLELIRFLDENGINQTPDARFCFVNEYFHGVSLSALILNSPSALLADNLPNFLRILKNMAEGLELMHSQGFYDGDVKPENMLVSDWNNSKLCDFGLISRIGFRIWETIAPNYSRNKILGTPPYMAPECYDPNSRMSGIADIYSLGISLLDLIKFKSSKKSLHLFWSTPDLTDIWNSIPKEINQRLSIQVKEAFLYIVKKSTAESQTDRYQTSAEFSNDLSGLIGLLINSGKIESIRFERYMQQVMDSINDESKPKDQSPSSSFDSLVKTISGAIKSIRKDS